MFKTSSVGIHQPRRNIFSGSYDNAVPTVSPLPGKRRHRENGFGSLKSLSSSCAFSNIDLSVCSWISQDRSMVQTVRSNSILHGWSPTCSVESNSLGTMFKKMCKRYLNKVTLVARSGQKTRFPSLGLMRLLEEALVSL